MSMSTPPVPLFHPTFSRVSAPKRRHSSRLGRLCRQQARFCVGDALCALPSSRVKSALRDWSWQLSARNALWRQCLQAINIIAKDPARRRPHDHGFGEDVAGLTTGERVVGLPKPVT